MADRFSLPITQYIPPNLRPLFQSVGADDVSNLVPTTGLRRGMEAAGRIGTAGEKPEDRIEAGLETLIPALTLGAGRFLKQPAKAALMEMFGLSPGPDAEAQLEALTRANSEAELLALQEQALQQPVVDIQDVSGVAPFQQLGEGEVLAPLPDEIDVFAQPQYDPEAEAESASQLANLSPSELSGYMDNLVERDFGSRNPMDIADNAVDRILSLLDDASPDSPIDDSFGMAPFIGPDEATMEVVLRPEEFLPEENQLDPAVTTRIDPVTATDVDTGTRFVDMDILQPLLRQLRTDGLPNIMGASEFEDDLLSAFSPVRSMADFRFGEATIDIEDRVRVARRIAEDAGVSPEIINDYFHPDDGLVVSVTRENNTPPTAPGGALDPFANVSDPNPFDQTGFRFGLFEDSVLRNSLDPVLAGFPKQKFGSVDQFVKTLENRGVKPAELEARGLATKDLRNRFPDGVSLDEVFDQLVEDPIAVTVLKGDRVAYRQYFTPGGSNYQETVLTLNQNFDDGARGLPGADEHFGSLSGVPVVHYRSAVFPVAKDGGIEGTSSFHLGEIQSDITQRSRSAVQARNVLDSLPKGMLGALNSVESVGDARGDVLLEFFDQLSPDVKKKYLADELDFSAKELSKVFDSLDPSYKKRRAASILSDLQYEALEEVPEDVGLGKLFKTNRVTDMAIKSAFDQVALPSNEGLEFFTLGTGDMAFNMTMGSLSGQREYYDKIVPSRIKNILAKLEKDSGLEMPKLGNVTIAGRDRSGGEELYDVPGFEITENFLRALRETGISAFRDGGMVRDPRFTGLGSMGYML